MHIAGTKFWNNKSKWYIQTNNALEAYLEKLFEQYKLKISYYESCGISSGCTGCAMVGADLDSHWSPEGELFDFLNSPLNYALYKNHGIVNPEGRIGNRNPYTYPLAVQHLFDVSSYIITHQSFSQIIHHQIIPGYAVQFCFLKPAHFSVMTAYDDETSEIIYCDPWPGNPMNKNGGWQERMNEKMFTDNVQQTFIIYKGKE